MFIRFSADFKPHLMLRYSKTSLHSAYILIAAQEAYLWKSSVTVTVDSPTWEISGNPLNGGYF